MRRIRCFHTTVLQHHGILGMKWGVRRFQNKDGTLTNAGKKRYNEDDSGSKKGDTKRGLSDKQKRAIAIGAAVAVAALATYGAYKLGAFDRFKKDGENVVKGLLGDFGDIDPKTGFKKLTKKETVEDVLSKVNVSGSHNNCYNVVVGTVCRLCGLDVVAKGDTQGGKGLSFDEVCKVFKLNPDNGQDVRRIMNPTVERITSQIGKRYSEGDVGAIGLGWNDAYKRELGLTSSEKAGHTLNWIIRNGEVSFLDGQANISGQKLKTLMAKYLDSGIEVSFAKFANVSEGLDLSKDLDLNSFRKFVD